MIDSKEYVYLYDRGERPCAAVHGDLVCGKPGIYSELCSCDKCDAQPGYHRPSWLCAEHYDKMMARLERGAGRAAKPTFGDEDL